MIVCEVCLPPGVGLCVPATLLLYCTAIQLVGAYPILLIIIGYEQFDHSRHGSKFMKVVETKPSKAKQSHQYEA